MSDVQIDSQQFQTRLHTLQHSIGPSNALMNGASSILVVTGKTNEENSYTKSAALHYLDPLKNEKTHVWARGKDPQENKQLFQNLIQELGQTVGVIQKDVQSGPFYEEWKAVKDAHSPAFAEVDISMVLTNAFAVKDEEELRTIRTASKATSGLTARYFVDEMSTIIDEEQQVKHSALAERVDTKIDDDSFFSTLKLGSDFDSTQLDWCYTPIIQSGGKYDLKVSAVSDDNFLKGDVIVCMLGLRYKLYCSSLARTYLIDPTPQQEQQYSFMVALQKKVLEAIKDQVLCKDVYEAAISYIKEKMPSLESHFLKNVGWGIGIEFRDTSLLLNSKNNHKLTDGMTLNVVVGFSDLRHPDDPHAKPYSLLLSDTCRVTSSYPIVFTDAPKTRGDVSFYSKDEDDTDQRQDQSQKSKSKQKDKNKESKDQDRARSSRRDGPKVGTAAVGNNGAILKSKLRNETKNHEDDAELKRRAHQASLHEKLQQTGLKQFKDGVSPLESNQVVQFKRFESYKRDNQLPPTVKDLRIQVDLRAQTILIPINGRPVPFHISTYKNGSKNDENEYTFLRLNFNSPGQTINKKEETPFENPEAHFVRSLTLRSLDTEHMSDVFKKIQDLKKETIKREAERKELADVVEQAKLVEVRNKRPLRMDSVFVRPTPEGKRVAGALEIHENGVRYQSPVRSDHRIEVLFSNVKNLFFQPCDHELVVLIHMHLKSPILVGKKKTKDVQFYREAADMAFDETGNKKRRYRYGDEDELEQEQEERRRRVALNKEFKAFGERICEASNNTLDLDIPFRDLGFEGVPFRASVLCQPTTECLIQLIDPPFLVIALHEIELAHLERVQFGLKQFDLVLVFKDYSKPVCQINSIPVSHLDGVKDWLNEMDIPYYEGPVNLNWPTIMKTIQADPHEFYQGGGWTFLSTETDGSDEEQSEEESEFDPTDEEPEDESSDAYSDEDSASSEYDDGDGSASGDEDEEEEGEDWDELDKKARQEDTRREDPRRKR